jgi:hypothetical protein
MPQFKPYRWIKMIGLTLILLTILVNFIHLVSLPSILKINCTRTFLTFEGI